MTTAAMNALEPVRGSDPASLRPQPKRRGSDFWPTPACLSGALIRYVLPNLPAAPATPVWECAAGAGQLVEAIRVARYIVLATDIAPRGAGIERRDFLHEKPPATGTVVCTNPPFNTLDRFVTRGLQLLDRRQISGLVLLVRCDALTAARRADAFNRAADVWVCCWRPRWIVGTTGTGRWSNAWVVWLAGYGGPPQTHWLRPERQQRQGVLAEVTQ